MSDVSSYYVTQLTDNLEQVTLSLRHGLLNWIIYDSSICNFRCVTKDIPHHDDQILSAPSYASATQRQPQYPP